MIPSMFSRDQLKRAATLTEEDFVQLDKCRASECDPLANGIDLSLLEHTAQSNGTMSCSTANISSIESSSASAVAQKGSSLAYKITRISLVPFFIGAACNIKRWLRMIVTLTDAPSLCFKLFSEPLK